MAGDRVSPCTRQHARVCRRHLDGVRFELPGYRGRVGVCSGSCTCGRCRHRPAACPSTKRTREPCPDVFTRECSQASAKAVHQADAWRSCRRARCQGRRFEPRKRRRLRPRTCVATRLVQRPSAIELQAVERRSRGGIPGPSIDGSRSAVVAWRNRQVEGDLAAQPVDKILDGTPGARCVTHPGRLAQHGTPKATRRPQGCSRPIGVARGLLGTNSCQRGHPALAALSPRGG